jgi:hypothetical protein
MIEPEEIANLVAYVASPLIGIPLTSASKVGPICRTVSAASLAGI